VRWVGRGGGGDVVRGRDAETGERDDLVGRAQLLRAVDVAVVLGHLLRHVPRDGARDDRSRDLAAEVVERAPQHVHGDPLRDSSAPERPPKRSADRTGGTGWALAAWERIWLSLGRGSSF